MVVDPASETQGTEFLGEHTGFGNASFGNAFDVNNHHFPLTNNNDGSGHKSTTTVVLKKGVGGGFTRYE